MTEQQTTEIPMLRIPRSAHPVPTTPRLRSAQVSIWAYALVIVAVFAGSILVAVTLAGSRRPVAAPRRSVPP